MKISLWQALALAEHMRKHDDPSDESLNAAHADLRNLDEDGRPSEGGYLIEVRWDDGHRLVLWGDGTDATDDYPEVLDPAPTPRPLRRMLRRVK